VGNGSFGRERGNSTWGNIIKVGKEIDRMGVPFSDSFGKLVGDGADTKFWEDSWLDGGKLKDRFNILYLLELKKEATISERGEFVNGVWGWRWDWRREPRGRERGELERLRVAVQGKTPITEKVDRNLWRLDTGDGYTVKVLRRFLEESEVLGGDNERETEWLKAIPKKIGIFVWRATLGRLPVRTTLDKMGIDVDSVLCSRCKSEVETIEHALFKCDKVKTLWSGVGRWWNLNVESCNSLDELTNVDAQSGRNKKGARRWVAVIRCIMYFIWMDRNKVVFVQSGSSVEDILLNLQLKTFEWVTRRDKEIAVDWNSWMMDPFGT